MKNLMKSTLTTLFISLFFLSIWACQDHDMGPSPDTCKLTAIDRGNLNKHIYAYDSQGRITTMTREFDGDGSGTVSAYVYTFTYDGAGLLIKSTWTLDGKPAGSETYTYTNGRIGKVAYDNGGGDTGFNTIRYNAAGQMSEFTYETDNHANDAKQYFAYNAEGVMTKRSFSDLQDNKFFEVVVKPMNTVKAAEALLATHGLPYDVLTGIPWAVAYGGLGTTDEFFEADATGKLVSGGTSKTTAPQTNAKGYLTEITFTDQAGQSSTERFTMTDCN